jgi:hypothetical protein
MEPTGAILHDGPLAQSLTRMHETLPRGTERIEILTPAQQQRLGNAARRLATYEPCRQYARMVCHQQVPWIQVLPHIGKPTMLQRTVLTMKHEQPTAVARFGGGLGYEFLWKLVVKVIGAHIFLLYETASQSGNDS